jgi:N-acetylglutamate synthase-like GNAT family acetyltransferase
MPTFRPARFEDYAAIQALLDTHGLPSEDVAAGNEAGRFHLAEQDG